MKVVQKPKSILPNPQGHKTQSQGNTDNNTRHTPDSVPSTHILYTITLATHVTLALCDCVTGVKAETNPQHNLWME